MEADGIPAADSPYIRVRSMRELGEIDKGVGGCEQTEERERLRDTDDYREKERENGVTEIVGNGVRSNKREACE